MQRHLFFFLLALCFIFHAIAPAKNRSLEEFNCSLDEIDCIANGALQTFNVPGASITIVFGDCVLLSKGYGLRDLDHKLPVTEYTLFPIASCTKAFTALALGLLVEENRIEFDDLVKQYIPEFYVVDQDRTAHLTIRDLLAHRTGIARHDPIWFYSEISKISIIELLKNLEPACDLRQDFQYNNFMYAVAGMIVERVTGVSWEEFISSRLLKPLDMNNSTTSDEELKCRLDFSLPYAEINGTITKIPFRNADSLSPAGGIISCALDMANWLKLQLGQGKLAHVNLIQRQVLKETHTIQMPLSSMPHKEEKIYHKGYGLGWFIGKYREYDFISHGGDIDGFSSEVALLPEKKIGLVILTNSSTDGRYAASTIRNQIFDKILGIKDVDWINNAKEIRKKTQDALYKTLAIFNENDQISSSSSLESFVGIYVHPAYGKIELKIENNHLIASFGKVTTSLKFNSENIFTGEFSELLIYGVSPLIDFKFFKDSSGTGYKMEIPFERFRSAKPITFTRSYLG